MLAKQEKGIGGLRPSSAIIKPPEESISSIFSQRKHPTIILPPFHLPFHPSCTKAGLPLMRKQILHSPLHTSPRPP